MAVFNSNDYEVQTALTQARADNLYYIRDGDNVHEGSLTVNNFYVQGIDPPNDSNMDLTIGLNASTIQIGGGNAAVVTTIKKLKTQGVLKAEDGIETSSIGLTGALSHTGTEVNVTGMLYANAGLNMGSSLIDLGQPTATRVSGNLGYVYTGTLSNQNLSTNNRTLLNLIGWPIGVWAVNIKLQFTVHPGISNINILFGRNVNYTQYAYIQQPTTATQSKSVFVSINTVCALLVPSHFQINSNATYTGTVPSLSGAGSSVSITRIG